VTKYIELSREDYWDSTDSPLIGECDAYPSTIHICPDGLWRVLLASGLTGPDIVALKNSAKIGLYVKTSPKGWFKKVRFQKLTWDNKRNKSGVSKIDLHNDFWRWLPDTRFDAWVECEVED
jgi:hypothetical protein